MQIPTTPTPPAAIVPLGETGAEVIHKLPRAAFTIRPQVRRLFEERTLAGLAQSMREQGVLHPLLCFRDGDDKVIIDGERRWRAAGLAEIDVLPARILEDRLSIAEALARQLTCNLQTEPLNPIERAEGIKNFMEASGLSGKEAAKQLGMEPSSLCRAMGPLKLPTELRQRIIVGEISADAAYLLSRVPDPAVQAQLAERVVSGGLTRDQLAKAVRAALSGRRPPPLSPPMVAAAAGTPATGSSKTASWRITRTIAPGVALAVTGTGESFGELLSVLERFITRGREACAQGIRLPRFLAEFRQTPTSNIASAGPAVPA